MPPEFDAIKDGLLGDVVWASGGFGRNRNQRGEFPARVTSSGGIYLQKDREVPDTFFMNVVVPLVDDAARVLGGPRCSSVRTAKT